MTAAHSGIIPQQVPKEDIFSNPFYETLRREFEQTLIASIQRDPPALVVVPSSAALSLIPKGVLTSKKFAESHILLSAHVPGLYCSVRGNPVEHRNERLVLTLESVRLVSSVISVENVYEFGYSFKVLLVDKPLTADRGNVGDSAATETKTGGGPSEYLAAVPLVETDFLEKVIKLRKTYILVPGYETHLAARIRDISNMAGNQVVRYLASPPGLAVVQADIERSVYATLHAWIYPHLVNSAGDQSRFAGKLSDRSLIRIEQVLREQEASIKILQHCKQIAQVVEAEVVPIFAKIALGVTPQQKINHMVNVLEKIGSVLAHQFHISGAGGEDILAVLTVAVILANYDKAQIDLAYADMFLSAHEELKNTKAAFAVTNLRTCIEFLLTLTI